MGPVTIRTATAQDLQELGAAAGRPGYWVAAVQDGTVLGAGGIVPAGATWVAACVIRPEVRARLREYRRPLLRAARATLELARARQMPVYAEADRAVPGAVAFLEHLGFRPHPAGGYVLKGPHV